MSRKIILIKHELLLLYYYLNRRELHSFPTRRSSDLGYDSPETISMIRPRVLMPVWKYLHCVRSEEHTSELQSLTKVVCRLLLDKIKFMRASIKMIGVSNLQSFIASMTQKLTLSDISDESKNYLDKA